MTMRKIFVIAAMMCGYALNTMAQTDYEHAQTRVQEAMSEFFVRPMVAELKMINTECQEYGPFNIYPGVPLSDISIALVQDAKANAAYKAAQIAGADIILGATFYVVNNKKQKGLDIIVKGYPAKYTDFHNYGDKSTDEKWVGPLQEGVRIRSYQTGSTQTASVSNETRNK